MSKSQTRWVMGQGLLLVCLWGNVWGPWELEWLRGGTDAEGGGGGEGGEGGRRGGGEGGGAKTRGGGRETLLHEASCGGRLLLSSKRPLTCSGCPGASPRGSLGSGRTMLLPLPPDMYFLDLIGLVPQLAG